MAGKLSSMFDARDMTEGSPVSNLIQFSIPLLVGNLAQQLYNTVDSIVVGQYVGDNALAAVGASGPLLNLLLVLFMGVATGAGIMVSPKAVNRVSRQDFRQILDRPVMVIRPCRH